jgi:uncharacterized protein with HEPN domain
MTRREYRDYLYDILQSITDVSEFISGMNYKKFLTGRKTSNAVIRSIEVIGEAAKQVPKGIRDKAPAIPWNEMVGVRNKIIHEYFGVDYRIVRKTAKHYLPKLKTPIVKLIKQIEKQD